MIEILVTGPPCAGKTTWVKENAPGLPVLDYDELYSEISGLPKYGRSALFDLRVMEEWSRRTKAARRSPEPVVVVTTAPKRWQRRQFGARRVVILATLPEICAERVHQAGRPDRWRFGIWQWWERYEPEPGALVVQSSAEQPK